MGLLTEIASSVAKATGPSEDKAAKLRESIIETGAEIFESVEQFKKYKGIANLLESENQKEQYEAGLTLLMLERTRQFIENMKNTFGEATVTNSLGALPTRVLDVVRLFYPNQIANELVDIQPIDSQVGSIFTLRPRYTNTFGGITAGDEVFKATSNFSNYASEEFAGYLATDADGIVVNFSGTISGSLLPVRPGSVVIETYIGGVLSKAVDDGNGNLVGVDVSSGTVDYSTAALDITYSTAPDDTTPTGADNPIEVHYFYDSETTPANIRSVEFDISEQPVKARMHPITFKYSVSAGLVAKASFGVDVQDTLAELAAQTIKVERDELLVRTIASHTAYDSNLDFDATPPTTYQRQAFYGEIELKLDYAESYIQNTQGRGSVDWVLCGRNAANLLRNVKGFRAAPTAAPIGPHVIGTLRDGTVTVVKVIKDAVLDPNAMLFGYKGYMAGDSATILAEWIPVYFTPTFQDPRFQNEQGVMSMYDLFINNAGYYVGGYISNYSA